jgi:Na+-driven multidrug efflux pump
LVGEQLLSIYTSDTAVIEWGIIRIQLICPIYFFVGIMEIGTAFLRGMGKSIQPMIITLLGSCLFRILWVNTICVIFPNDITILFTCYPISWIITSIVLYLYFILVYKKEKLKLKTDC